MFLIPFFLIFSSLFAVRDKCIAPLKMPPQPPSSFKRIMTIILTRHGSRSPMYYYPNAYKNTHKDSEDSNLFDINKWNCSFEIAHLSKIGPIRKRFDPKLIEYPPSCTTGQLTKEGFDQHYRLGITIRKYLDNRQNSIFGNYIDRNDVYLRTTAIERAYKSAVSFMQGFAPPGFPDELLEIISGSDSYDMLRPNKRQCVEMAEMYNNFSKTEEFRTQLINGYEVMRDVFNYLQINIRDPKSRLKENESKAITKSKNKTQKHERNDEISDKNTNSIARSGLKLLSYDSNIIERPKIAMKNKTRSSKHSDIDSSATDNPKSTKKAINTHNKQIDLNGHLTDHLSDSDDDTTYYQNLHEAEKGACDYVITNDCFETSNFVFSNVSLEKRAEIVKHCERFIVDSSTPMRIVSFSQSFRAFFKLIDDRLSLNNRYKMALFSAHDSSVTEMLSALGQKVLENPPYASFVISEVLQKGSQFYVRFSFNGDVLAVPGEIAGEEIGLGTGIYSFHKFRMNFQPLIDHCHDFDEF